ncbi:MAG TPA: outer membrane lipoprotein carrier protein LolA, partial [Polyangiaceae bacterium]|nr:outer membrane lipoprotein carrier protein LolA [Polyangiaceae bacterium]
MQRLSPLIAVFVAFGALLCAHTSGAQPAPVPAPAPNVDQVVTSVQAFYDKSSTFKSDFEQKFWVKAYNTEKTSRGHVTFSKPGKMEWVYAEPKDNRVVSDGSVIRVYEANNKQMYEQPVDTTQYLAAVSFLTG